MSATESAVLVAVPAAEEVVGRFRARLDTSAAWGVPPHVTVLYPFVPPDALDAAVLARLAEAVGSVPAFDLILAQARWFGEDVLWLAPEPDAPFRALTAAVWHQFPDRPPYGGAFDDVVPHLTVGHSAPIDVLRAAAREIEPRLPVRARVGSVLVMTGSPDTIWQTVAELPLAPPEPEPVPPPGESGR